MSHETSIKVIKVSNYDILNYILSMGYMYFSHCYLTFTSLNYYKFDRLFFDNSKTLKLANQSFAPIG